VFLVTCPQSRSPCRSAFSHLALALADPFYIPRVIYRAKEDIIHVASSNRSSHRGHRLAEQQRDNSLIVTVVTTRTSSRDSPCYADSSNATKPLCCTAPLTCDVDQQLCHSQTHGRTLNASSERNRAPRATLPGNSRSVSPRVLADESRGTPWDISRFRAVRGTHESSSKVRSAASRREFDESRFSNVD